MEFRIAINRFEKLTTGLQEGRSQLRVNYTLRFNYSHEDGLDDPHLHVANSYSIKVSTFPFLGESSDGELIASENLLNFTRSVFLRYIPERRWSFRRTLIGRWIMGRPIQWRPLYIQSTLFNISEAPSFDGDLSPFLTYSNQVITSQEFESSILDVSPAREGNVSLPGAPNGSFTIPRADKIFIKVSLIDKATGNVVISKNSRVLTDAFFGDNEPRLNRTA